VHLQPLGHLSKAQDWLIYHIPPVFEITGWFMVHKRVIKGTEPFFSPVFIIDTGYVRKKHTRNSKYKGRKYPVPLAVK
jgi:hypothetical protein